MIDLIILTGVYGAGRTVAMKNFEEDEYFTMDNLPLSIAKVFFDNCVKEQNKYRKVAMSVANSEAEEFYKLAKRYSEFKLTFIGITCSDAVLRDRYRLENKMHPLQMRGLSLDEAIKIDKQTIRALTDYFDVFIDTTKLAKSDFKNILYTNVLDKVNKFTVNIFTFGYKRVIPQDIETVFDVRILRNPYWEEELKDLNGLNSKVRKFVLSDPNTKPLLKHILKYLEFYIPTLKNEGRNHANIGIACSAGKQRSIVIAEELRKCFKEDYKVNVVHRDIDLID